MADTLVSIRDITKRFGHFTAVDQVSLDIGSGEFFSLLGASGCGKTTLLRMLGGFELPSSGEIWIDGEPTAALPPNRRPTNMVFQSYALFPHLTIAENIAYGLRTMPGGREDKAKIVERSLSMIRLTDKAGRRPHELSGGQRQRVALARALARSPKVLLLDEPLSALDKQLREEMQFELRDLQRRVGVTFVFVTHDQDEALALSDRIAVMGSGRILQVDTPARIYEAPQSRSVAGFIGTMNFFAGRLVRYESGKAVVDAGPAGQIEVMHDGALGRLRAGDGVVVGVRPEKIDLQGGSEVNRLTGEIAASSYLGDRSHLLIRVPGLEKPIAVAAQNTSRSHMAPAAAVTLGWKAANGILLPENGAWSDAA